MFPSRVSGFHAFKSIPDHRETISQLAFATKTHWAALPASAHTHYCDWSLRLDLPKTFCDCISSKPCSDWNSPKPFATLRRPLIGFPQTSYEWISPKPVATGSPQNRLRLDLPKTLATESPQFLLRLDSLKTLATGSPCGFSQEGILQKHDSTVFKNLNCRRILSVAQLTWELVYMNCE